MKLRASFFDKTVFRKDILRFAPLWALYFIGGLLVMMTVTDSDAGYYAASTVGESIGPLAVVNIVYAALVVQLLFGDLYNARLCNALHAMPMRRENWFFTHVLAGLCYSLVPNALGIFFIMFRMQEFWFVAFIWLLGMTLQYLFFFGLGVLCAMCSGNRIAMAALYGIVNFASLLISGFCQLVYVPMMYGVELNTDGFDLFCPVVELAANNDFVLWERQQSGTGYVRYFDGFGDGWGYLAILAVLGVVFLAAGLLLYRRRKLECAGDFIAVRPLGPVFSVVFSLCVGAVFGLFGELVDSSYVPYLILGIIVGWFVGRMLLARTVKVFRIKELMSVGAVVAVLFVSIFLVQIDAFGIVRWTPLASQVKSVTIANYKSASYSGINGYYDYYYGNCISLEITDPQTVEEVIKAHEDILARQNEENVNSRYPAVFVYQLENGKTVCRSYSAPAGGTSYQIINKLLYTPENIMGCDSWEQLVKNMEMLSIDGEKVIGESLTRKMVQALWTDCEEGYVSFSDKLQAEHWVEYDYRNENGIYVSRYLGISSQAKNVMKLIDSPEYVLGFADEEAMLKSLSGIHVSDVVFVEGAQLESFISALYADCAQGHVTAEAPSATILAKLSYGKNDGELDWYLYVSAYAENIGTWLQEHYPEEWAAGAFG